MPDTTLTSAELDELERLAKAATPGPWKAETNEKAANVTILGRSADKGRTRASDGHAYLLTVDCSDGIDDGAYAPMMAEHVANAAFIAFANPATILALLSIARAGLEAGKAEESMRERAATVADDMRNKFGSRTGDAYSNGLWDQGVRIANTIRALPLTTEGGDKP